MVDKFMIDFGFYYNDIVNFLHDVGKISFEESERYLEILNKSNDEEAADLIAGWLIKYHIDYERYK